MEQELIAEKLQAYIDEEQDRVAGKGFFEKTLQQMDGQADNTFNRPIASRIPGVSFIKKLIRRMVAWYANPFAQQQAAFNKAAVKDTEYLGRKLHALQEENRQLGQRIEQLEDMVWKLQNPDLDDPA